MMCPCCGDRGGSGGCRVCVTTVYCGLCMASGCVIHRPGWLEEHMKAAHPDGSNEFQVTRPFWKC